MNRRRLVAALFFSAVIVATLAVIVYTEHVNADQTLSVWVLTHDVPAGASFKAGDVQQTRVPVPNGSFNYQQQGPDQVAARYVRNLRAQDILRSDDLTADAATAEVALSVQNAPPLSVGDSIDIFVALQSGQQARIGRNITVASVSGTSIDVLIPADDEAAWVTVGSSNTALHAVRTVPGVNSHPAPLSIDDAIGILCGVSCDTVPRPTPSPSQ